MKPSVPQVIAMLAALAAAAMLAVPAFAHAPVTGTSPKDGKITVYKAPGAAVAAKSSGLTPKNKALLRAVFSTNLAAGKYTVKWRALADDGHHQKGTFHFRIS